MARHKLVTTTHIGFEALAGRQTAAARCPATLPAVAGPLQPLLLPAASLPWEPLGRRCPDCAAAQTGLTLSAPPAAGTQPGWRQQRWLQHKIP